MASDPMLLGVDVPTPTQMNSRAKAAVCIFCSVIATIVLLNSLTASESGASEASTWELMGADGTALYGASAFTSARHPMLRGEATTYEWHRFHATVQKNLNNYGIGLSPLGQLAITAIDASTRRDVSIRASEVASGWSLVDDRTKEKLLNVIEEVKFKESILAGIAAPMNFFDPLGFSTTVTAGKLLFYREVELKHGRVAMLAALGIVVGENFHPLFGGDIDVPAAFAFQQTPLEAFWPAVVAAIAIPEIYSVFTFQKPGLNGATQWTMKEDHEPGNLGFDPLGLKPTDPKELKDMKTKELNNGRLAMIAAAGMIAQELATGQKLF
eukprot:gnl/TRDRNA2_/TRDRNA2_176684_c1_seq2.p1 gnl/TRDRNA2_/TRDRNA2_176684_c1~~gnl/TRDRNA2_/TRDRNA2_176684_c1_seq2.p1  ORF type:complete len:326 (-),score=64.71 gnl/TRDRNA2_/TRDRNA2_176684_c1_seq2:310-1287(-)